MLNIKRNTVFVLGLAVILLMIVGVYVFIHSDSPVMKTENEFLEETEKHNEDDSTENNTTPPAKVKEITIGEDTVTVYYKRSDVDSTNSSNVLPSDDPYRVTHRYETLRDQNDMHYSEYTFVAGTDILTTMSHFTGRQEREIRKDVKITEEEAIEIAMEFIGNVVEDIDGYELKAIDYNERREDYFIGFVYTIDGFYTFDFILMSVERDGHIRSFAARYNGRYNGVELPEFDLAEKKEQAIANGLAKHGSDAVIDEVVDIPIISFNEDGDLCIVYDARISFPISTDKDPFNEGEVTSFSFSDYITASIVD